MCVNFIPVKLLSNGDYQTVAFLSGALGSWEQEPSMSQGHHPSLCKTTGWLPGGSHSREGPERPSPPCKGQWLLFHSQEGGNPGGLPHKPLGLNLGLPPRHQGG